MKPSSKWYTVEQPLDGLLRGTLVFRERVVAGFGDLGGEARVRDVQEDSAAVVDVAPDGQRRTAYSSLWVGLGGSTISV